MDLLRMDERQRWHWLAANRATLMVVGVVWLLMIAFELSEGRTPIFLIAMVPVFAGLRFGFYWYYARDRDVKWIDIALFLGLFALGHWIATVFAWVQEFATSGFLWFVPAEPSHGFWRVAARVLEFPLGTLLPNGSSLPDWLEIVLVTLNSLLWAGAAYLIVRAARRARGLRQAAA
jgi:hypothetical protein